MDAAAALLDGRWSEAAREFAAAAGDSALSEVSRADVLDGLAEACWGLGDERAAVTAAEQAFRLRRANGDLCGAARTAAWLAREHAAALGDLPLARGWLARAETVAGGVDDPAAHGWIALSQAAIAVTVAEQANAAERAVERARAAGDGDLEILALARLGLARVIDGSADAGLAALDEAVVAAAAGDAARASTAGLLCCDLVLAAELAGARDRLSSWFAELERASVASGRPIPFACCTTCSSETAAVHGEFQDAEQRLHVAVVELQRSGGRSRCIQPSTRLAELLLNQGRIEEAQHAIGANDDSSALLVRARIALAAGEPVLAATLAERAARRSGTASTARPAVLGMLVEAHLAARNETAAGRALEQLAAAVENSPDERARALLALARGRVSAANQDPAAEGFFEAALDATAGAVCAESAHAYLALARLRHADRPSVARVDAKAALRTFEALGHSQLADATAALLRSLGDRSRVGPKDVGELTKREQEILLLLAQGLTNAEIAARLYISTKTAGNHVSAILAKLGVRSRTEAAAYVAMHSR